MNELTEQIQDKLEAWGRGLALMLPNLLGALAVLLGFWLLSLFAGRFTARFLRRISDHTTLNDLLVKLARFAVLATGLVVSLQVLDLEDAAMTLLAGAGIAGIAIGFAFQDLSANFISGVAMAVRRPIQAGDVIESNDFYGTVEGISLRSTILRMTDGALVLIPNRKVYENPTVVYTEVKARRVEFQVGINYGEDLERVRDVALEALRSVERYEDREVEVFYLGFGDSSIDFIARLWVPFRRPIDLFRARSEAVIAIKKAFDRNGITIPFPIRTLDFSSDKVGGGRLREQLDVIGPH